MDDSQAGANGNISYGAVCAVTFVPCSWILNRSLSGSHLSISSLIAFPAQQCAIFLSLNPMIPASYWFYCIHSGIGSSYSNWMLTRMAMGRLVWLYPPRASHSPFLLLYHSLPFSPPSKFRVFALYFLSYVCLSLFRSSLSLSPLSTLFFFHSLICHTFTSLSLSLHPPSLQRCCTVASYIVMGRTNTLIFPPSLH